MRLIDADELKKVLCEEYEAREHYSGEKMLEAIDNAPTVEEVSVIEFKEPLPPVKAHKIIRALNKRPQGEWINHRNDYGHNIADCSLCGKAMQWHDEDEDGIPRYCWYCGASMKGGKEE